MNTLCLIVGKKITKERNWEVRYRFVRLIKKQMSSVASILIFLSRPRIFQLWVFAELLMFTNKIPSAGFSQTNENATILFLALVYSFFCRLVQVFSQFLFWPHDEQFRKYFSLIKIKTQTCYDNRKSFSEVKVCVIQFVFFRQSRLALSILHLRRSGKMRNLMKVFLAWRDSKRSEDFCQVESLTNFL